MTRYSQVLVHSTVVNSRLSHQYMSISLIFLAVLGFIVISATFCRVFAGFCAEFGCCFGDFCSFSYFFSAFLRLYGWVWGAVFGFFAVSATFSRLFSGFMAGVRVLFLVFCSFSYFFLAFLRLLSWVWGAVLVISAVSATFCEASGIMVEVQHHKLTTTY
ncbi:hypothetical protein ACTQ1L_10030 [Agathobacter sp. LCP21S3_B2]|uniref:hypothetical protein n=1 Tax=Agathobacter sp. LCP21S3_B2 TaxID=3438734 RepID=UPI003F8F0830